MQDLIKRKGKFEIHRDLIRKGDSGKLLKVFASMVIVRAEYNFIRDSVQYEALSPLFRETEDNEVLPEYTINITEIKDDDGGITDVVIVTDELYRLEQRAQ